MNLHTESRECVSDFGHSFWAFLSSGCLPRVDGSPYPSRPPSFETLSTRFTVHGAGPRVWVNGVSWRSKTKISGNVPWDFLTLFTALADFHPPQKKLQAPEKGRISTQAEVHCAGSGRWVSGGDLWRSETKLCQNVPGVALSQTFVNYWPL